MPAGMESTDRMFSVRIAPWHMGTGTNVSLLPDHPTREQVLIEAGLNWTVEEDTFRRTRNGTLVEGWRELYRSDTGNTLNIPRDSYVEIQNEVGVEVMEALLGEDSNVKYETGGSVKGGVRCYLCARIDEPFVVPGDNSPSYPFGLVQWAHDGTESLAARATTVRVVCANTMSAAEAESERSGRLWTFRHSANWRERIDEARLALAGIREETARFQELADELAHLVITDAQREQFVEQFIPAPVAEVISDRVRANIESARMDVHNLFDGVTIPEAHRNTGYGLLLAGTEYLDHLRGYRNTDTYLGRTLLTHQSLKAKLVPMIQEVANA